LKHAFDTYAGYGQTEATAAISVTIPGDYFSGCVGSPCLSVKIKLVDVPEKNYYAKENRGEVCVKGTSVSKGTCILNFYEILNGSRTESWLIIVQPREFLHHHL